MEGTGSRRLTNATGNKQATGQKQGEMIRGENWDKGLKKRINPVAQLERAKDFLSPLFTVFIQSA